MGRKYLNRRYVGVMIADAQLAKLKPELDRREARIKELETKIRIINIREEGKDFCIADLEIIAIVLNVIAGLFLNYLYWTSKF